ncbi:family 1 glycosylhydrolase [Nonomuraea wenchangensis]
MGRVIEWSRVEPADGHLSRAAVAHYRRVAEGAVARGLRPLVTLHHFTLPLWFAAGGGWLRPDATERFLRYVDALAPVLDAGVEHPMHAPTPGQWDSTLVEIGAPPVRTADNSLVFLVNGATASSPADVDYRCGQIAVALTDPATVVARTSEPWLRPTSFEDTHGLVANVTFVEGLVHFRGKWFAYYGQSDTTVAVAVCDGHAPERPS